MPTSLNLTHNTTPTTRLKSVVVAVDAIGKHGATGVVVKVVIVKAEVEIAVTVKIETVRTETRSNDRYP